MSIEAGLRTLWIAEATITAKLGSAQGVMLGTMDQGVATPYLVYDMGDTDHQDTLARSGINVRSDVRVDCYAERATEAIDLRDAVYEYMRDFTGTAGDQTITAVIARKTGTEFEQPWDGESRGRHVAGLTMDIAHHTT